MMNATQEIESVEPSNRRITLNEADRYAFFNVGHSNVAHGVIPVSRGLDVTGENTCYTGVSFHEYFYRNPRYQDSAKDLERIARFVFLIMQTNKKIYSITLRMKSMRDHPQEVQKLQTEKDKACRELAEIKSQPEFVRFENDFLTVYPEDSDGVRSKHNMERSQEILKNGFFSVALFIADLKSDIEKLTENFDLLNADQLALLSMKNARLQQLVIYRAILCRQSTSSYSRFEALHSLIANREYSNLYIAYFMVKDPGRRRYRDPVFKLSENSNLCRLLDNIGDDDRFSLRPAKENILRIFYEDVGVSPEKEAVLNEAELNKIKQSLRMACAKYRPGLEIPADLFEYSCLYGDAQKLDFSSLNGAAFWVDEGQSEATITYGEVLDLLIMHLPPSMTAPTSSNNSDPESLFHAKAKSLLSNMLQFFFMEAQVYSHTRGLSSKDFSSVLSSLSSKKAEKFIDDFSCAMQSDLHPENMLIEYINDNHRLFGLSVPLADIDKQNIKKEFTKGFSQIDGSRHYSEFGFLSGKGVFKNNWDYICVPIGEVYRVETGHRLDFFKERDALLRVSPNDILKNQNYVPAKEVVLPPVTVAVPSKDAYHISYAQSVLIYILAREKSGPDCLNGADNYGALPEKLNRAIAILTESEGIGVLVVNGQYYLDGPDDKVALLKQSVDAKVTSLSLENYRITPRVYDSLYQYFISRYEVAYSADIIGKIDSIQDDTVRLHKILVLLGLSPYAMEQQENNCYRILVSLETRNILSRIAQLYPSQLPEVDDEERYVRGGAFMRRLREIRMIFSRGIVSHIKLVLKSLKNIAVTLVAAPILILFFVAENVWMPLLPLIPIFALLLIVIPLQSTAVFLSIAGVSIISQGLPRAFTRFIERYFDCTLSFRTFFLNIRNIFSGAANMDVEMGIPLYMPFVHYNAAAEFDTFVAPKQQVASEQPALAAANREQPSPRMTSPLLDEAVRHKEAEQEGGMCSPLLVFSSLRPGSGGERSPLVGGQESVSPAPQPRALSPR